MINALKTIVIPSIKQRGFSGTFPHLRRKDGHSWYFLSFQFNRHEGSFVVESAQTDNLSKDLIKLAENTPPWKIKLLMSNY